MKIEKYVQKMRLFSRSKNKPVLPRHPVRPQPVPPQVQSALPSGFMEKAVEQMVRDKRVVRAEDVIKSTEIHLKKISKKAKKNLELARNSVVAEKAEKSAGPKPAESQIMKVTTPEYDEGLSNLLDSLSETPNTK